MNKNKILLFLIMIIAFFIYFKLNPADSSHSMNTYKIIDKDDLILKSNIDNRNLESIFRLKNITNPDYIRKGLLKNTKIYSINPLVFTIDNYLSNDDVNNLKKIIDNKKFEPSTTIGSDGKIVTSKDRNNTVSWLNTGYNEETKKICGSISTLLNTDLSHSEDMQIIRYEKGQEYKYHYDTFEGKYLDSEFSNQRLYTVLVYLSDVEMGGETSFDKLNINISPKKGKLLFFQNCLDKTNIRDYKTSHAGLPVKKGIKYAFNLWFREKPITVEKNNKLILKQINQEEINLLKKNIKFNYKKNL